MVTVAGLFIRGSLKAAQANPGFSVATGLLVELDADLPGYDATRGRELYRAVTERLQSLAGVESVTMAATVPFGMHSEGREVQRGGVVAPTDAAADSPATGKSFWSSHNLIGTDYFKTLGVALAQGREFSPAEMQPGTAARVAIIDELLARRLWPGQEALGRSIQFAARTAGEPPQTMEVVGIVPTLRNKMIEPQPTPHIYVPFGQEYRGNRFLHVKTRTQDRAGQLALLQTVRREIGKVDEHVPILTLRPLRDHVEANPDLWMVRTAARLFTALGALALLLAVVGVYGVRAYLVARRTREIGIRMALGATTRDVLSMILREGMRLTLVGVGVGLLLALAVGLVLRSMLYEVRAVDPVTFGLAPLLLATAALLACYLPGRRAARIDPMVALRWE
jgi:predicted permease